MPITVVSSGSQALTAGASSAEVSLGSFTTAGTYQVLYDLAALGPGDTVEVSVYSRVPSVGGTRRRLFVGSFANTQISEIAQSIPVLLPEGGLFEAVIRQTSGTSRTVPWEVRRAT